MSSCGVSPAKPRSLFVPEPDHGPFRAPWLTRAGGVPPDGERHHRGMDESKLSDGGLVRHREGGQLQEDSAVCHRPPADAGDARRRRISALLLCVSVKQTAIKPRGAFQHRSTSALHPHISKFYKIWSMGLSDGRKTAVPIFFLCEQRLPSYSLRQFGEVTFYVFLWWPITPSQTHQIYKNYIPMDS